ncbi:DNA polymerase III subunit gamma/tau [candidate division WWE3 bacterium]|uniref:DNA polymerase III subunit gamma/tau n=1 Tax=candidate division WWE3 bacterium TaxID=2053526 RepID=A0A7X9DKA7_UNCKA|nr:DNA polymerase III subunit gamma/tau [candidate division WWE3 bacterium]
MYYTKYRPQKFSEIARPNEVAEAISKQVATGKTVHAYLFVGPRGTGKTSTARILAKALNCEKVDKQGDPCGECSVCMAIKEGSFIDLHEIDAASNRGIDDIRDLKDRIKLAPAIGKVKVYIIDEVHMLTMEAFNALLKTLEEPPKNTVFILCTTELHKVPETIKSRCQMFKFKRATTAQLVEKLSKIAKSEKAKISREDLEKISRASVGGFRDAETLLQQVVEGEVSVDSLISLTSKHSMEDFVKSLWDKNTKDSLNIVDSTFDDGIDLYVWVGELLRYVRSMLLLKSGFSIDMLDFPEELFEDKKLMESIDIPWLVFVVEQVSLAHAQIKMAYLPQLPLEIAVLNIIGQQGNSTVFAPEAKPSDPGSPNPVISGGSTTKAFKVSSEKLSSADKGYKESDKESKKAEKVEVVENALFTLDQINEKWNDILNKVKELNSTVQALLKAGKPFAVNGKFILIEVYYSFHKERLESNKNRVIVEKALAELFGIPLSIKCELSNNKPKHLSDREVGVLTDHNIVVPGGEKFDRDKVLSMLDGGLPL